MEASNRLQPLSISLVILGIIFGEDSLIGYSFIGAGVVLTISSSLIARRRRRASEYINKAFRDD
jgi:LPXTG-motif cell wall-anchored protein